MEEKTSKQKDISSKIADLPTDVQDVIASAEIAEVNAQIRDRYKLTDEQLRKMLKIILKVFLKDISIENFPKILENKLEVEENTAKKISLEIAQKEFFLAREYLPDVENLIKNLGGEIPKIISKPKPKISSVSKPKKIFKDISQSKSESKIVQKDIKSAIREYDELENQIITSFPIKIVGISETIKPSIKNWLNDYIQSVGVGQHSNIERLDYLYHNSNAIKLKESERRLLAEILKSYDEEIMLPIRNGRVDLKFLKEKLLKERLRR